MSNPEWWERAISGTCSHGGHGWDGDTCSDAPDHDCGEPGRPVEVAQCPGCWDVWDEAH